jgi:site-specific DNA recombinase
MKAVKYFLYARKSSEAEERQAMSIESQLVELDLYAQREGIKIAERFIESKSAKTPGRTEFNNMIEKIYSSKEPIGIISWHPDRLARNSVDGGQIIYLIDIQKICAMKFPTFWFEPTPQGLFMLQVAFGQSKYYSDNLSENIKRGLRQKLRRGEWPSFAPFGYVNNPKTRNIEPDSIKAKILAKLFKDYADGKESVESLRQRLSLYGIFNSKGGMCSKSRIYLTLKNPVYIGKIRIKGELYEGTFPSIISNEVFEAVQARLHNNHRPRKSKNKHDFPFTGLFKCEECGCSITAQYGKGLGGTYRYYRCTKKKQACSQGYMQEYQVADQLRAELKKITLPESWYKTGLEQIQKWSEEEKIGQKALIQNIGNAILEVKRKLDKLVNGFLEGIIEKDTYLEKKEKLIIKKGDLEEQSKQFGEKAIVWVEHMMRWLEAAHQVESISKSENYGEIKLFVEKIGSNCLLQDKKVKIKWNEPYLILSKYNVLGGELKSKNKKEADSKKEGLPLWWSLMNEAKTYFKAQYKS